MIRMPRVLVVDDEKEVATFFRHLLKANYQVTIAYSGDETKKAISTKTFDVALVDLKLPDSDGLTLLELIKRSNPYCNVIIMTGYSTITSAVEAIRLGAFNYIEKPFEDLKHLKKMIDDALSTEEQTDLDESEVEGFVIGNNRCMRNIVSVARKVADKKVTILIEGETGTGKEVLARYIHRHSQRANHPFIAVNCGAFTESLLESELFGHEKGSFTGALSARKGIFEMANQGTLFLDEIGEASLVTQVKFLRVLEKPDEIYRVGGERLYKSDVRFIAATNINLKDAVEQGRFRRDLFYRLNVINFKLPPLRDRKEDIPILVNYITRHNFLKRDIVYARDTMDYLKGYHWPGNIRELVNVVAHIVALADGREVTPELLPQEILYQRSTDKDTYSEKRLEDVFTTYLEEYFSNIDLTISMNFQDLLEGVKTAQAKFIKSFIKQVLQHNNGNHSEAAKQLSINNRQLQYYLNEK